MVDSFRFLVTKETGVRCRMAVVTSSIGRPVSPPHGNPQEDLNPERRPGIHKSSCIPAMAAMPCVGLCMPNARRRMCHLLSNARQTRQVRPVGGYIPRQVPDSQALVYRLNRETCTVVFGFPANF